MRYTILIKIVMVVSLCLIVSAQSSAQQLQQVLQQALTTYQQAQAAENREQRLATFRRAEQLFRNAAEQAAQQGIENADIYANIGTAALQAERLGASIVAFRQALAINPSHPRAQQNLAHARQLLPAWLPRPEADVFDSFFAWQTIGTSTDRLAAAAFCFLLTALLLALAIRWRIALLRGITIFPGLLWLALLASIASDYWFAEPPAAVVIIDETIARAADSINAPAGISQPLPEGAEVTIQETRQDWIKIALADGRSAWVKRSSLVLL